MPFIGSDSIPGSSTENMQFKDLNLPDTRATQDRRQDRGCIPPVRASIRTRRPRDSTVYTSVRYVHNGNAFGGHTSSEGVKPVL
jgi:hypothetical protein